jgi:hypothetical protein
MMGCSSQLADCCIACTASIKSVASTAHVLHSQKSRLQACIVLRTSPVHVYVQDIGYIASASTASFCTHQGRHPECYPTICQCTFPHCSGSKQCMFWERYAQGAAQHHHSHLCRVSSTVCPALCVPIAAITVSNDYTNSNLFKQAERQKAGQEPEKQTGNKTGVN